MNLPNQLFPVFAVWASFILALFVVGDAVRHAPWKRLRNSQQQHVWLGFCVFLVALWLMKAGVRAGLNLHILGATLFTLLFGRRLAVIGMTLVLAGMTFNGHGGWESFALNFLFMVAWPTWVAQRILVASERYLPPHLFVYIFANGFFGSAVTVFSTGLVLNLSLALLDVYPADYLFSEYLPFFFLLAWSEAFLSGLLLTVMVVYRPHWVGSFDDRRYLRRR